MTTLTKFSNCKTTPIKKNILNLVVSGNPEHTSWLNFANKDNRIRSGVWQSTAGVFKGPINDQVEFCHILEGEALIKTQDGQEYSVCAGDAFVMDNGFQPIWHVKNFVKKNFVIVADPIVK